MADFMSAIFRNIERNGIVMKSKEYSSIRLEVTSHCNMKCEYCHNAEYSNREDDMSYGEIIELIGNLKKHYKINKILITGGEPLTNPNICGIISYITGLGIKADMVTNATLLTEDMVKKLESAGLKRIRISIDDVGAEESLRHGSHSQMLWQKVQMVREFSDIEVCIHTVCSPYNVDMLFDVYKKVIESGAARWRVFDVGFQGNLLKNMSSYDFESYYQKLIEVSKKIIQDYLKHGYQDRLDIEINNIFRTIMLHAVPSDDYDVMANLRERLEKSPCDYVADHQISVRSNGKATLCQYFHNTMFDFKEAGFDVDKAIAELSPVEEYQISMKDLKHCAKCKYCLVCNSGCRARAKFLTDDVKDADAGACYICEKVYKEIVPLLPENTQKAYNACIVECGLEPKYSLQDLLEQLKKKGAIK